ncbi:leucine-rich repeats and immunoglobulin-like domains protein 3 [Coccinella septempunctata]|uniref:leucine-rich repeats and immunoglobulin-like domains protein 3 n=1 Tax=Coccinella septempunctata TaxID=41139 RepID=UPI001D06F070|nr:leucine-rich repeats and immunoglobulin-like domains protein 3 [Coccinella septempunctata]
MRYSSHANMASALLLTMLNVSIIGCPMSMDILPCTCKMDIGSHVKNVQCTGLNSYNDVYTALHGHFGAHERVALKVLGSNLHDMPPGSFKKLNMSIVNLQLNHDNLEKVDTDVFEGLQGVTYFSLADNYIDQIPEHLWPHLPNAGTLDFGRTKIRELRESNFKALPHLTALIVPGCMITNIEKNSIPSEVQRLHLGRNSLTTLNGTIRNLSDLNWLFINDNDLTDLEDELPEGAQRLKMIHALNNKIEKLPRSLMTLPALETIFLQHNKLRSLDGCLSKSRRLQRVYLDNNMIDTLTEDDFKEAESLVHLLLGFNRITSLNNSLSGLRNLQFLNVTTNLMEEFSFEEIKGLEKLSAIDLSFNKISSIKGPPTNLIEWNIKLSDLKLDHNEIDSLNGSLSGLRELIRLNLSFNKLRKISPDDFMGLDKLSLLDLSHNYLKTLEEMSGTFLPKLEVLKASHNQLTILEKDFQGLPILCHADLANNNIIALGRELVSKTRCTLGNGANEGTWDTLKIYLQDNPILCDAALPEISAYMEINHTRIYGISHCPPLSEQPVTSKPNGFLGYIPETTATLTATSPKTIQLSKPLPLQESLDPLVTISNSTINDSIKLSKLASEIQQIKKRVEELATQIETKPEKHEDLGENRKP